MPTELSPLIRTVSGKGSIAIPEDFANASLIVLYMDVIREARSVYRNFNSNPSESFFARVAACYDDYVLQSFQVEFDRQMFQVFPGDVSDVMQAVKCLERSLFLPLKAIAIIAGGDITIPDPFPLDVYEPQGYVPNNFKFVCYGGTALRLTLKGFENENCGDAEFPRKKPPTPPPPPDKFDPDEPVDVSPPDPNYPDDTDPFEGDEVLEPPLELPIEGECLRYRLTITYDRYNVGSVTVQIDLGAPIIELYTENQVPFPAIDGIYALCNGVWGTGGECAGVAPTLIYNDVTGGTAFTIDSIELVV